jgi:hypothetical protein
MAIRQGKHGIERSLNGTTDENGVIWLIVNHWSGSRLERDPWGRTLLHIYQEEKLKGWVKELEEWGSSMRVNILP